MLIFGFFVGQPRAARHDRADEGKPSLIPRAVRKATRGAPRADQLSVLFVVIGLGLVLLGEASDSAHKLF